MTPTGLSESRSPLTVVPLADPRSRTATPSEERVMKDSASFHVQSFSRLPSLSEFNSSQAFQAPHHKRKNPVVDEAIGIAILAAGGSCVVVSCVGWWARPKTKPVILATDTRGWWWWMRRLFKTKPVSAILATDTTRVFPSP